MAPRPAKAVRPHRRRQAPKAPKIDLLGLPALPAISENLRVKVFTHKSLYGSATADEVDDTEPLDNERLALLGASVLQTIVAKVLYLDFPRHRKGWLSDQRTRFVRIVQVAEWSRAYRLPEQLQCHQSATISVRRSQDSQASLFEAYIGAVFLTGGLDTLEKWIGSLMRTKGEPYGDSSVRSPEEGDVAMRDSESAEGDSIPVLMVSSVQIVPPPQMIDIDPPELPLNFSPNLPLKQASSSPVPNKSTERGHLMLLQERASQRRIVIKWEAAESVLPGSVSSMSRKWTLQANVAGKCVGQGTARTKQAAKEIAAEQALKTLGLAAGVGD
ncbi:hypothetical protein BOTBODRAFT_51270 [Botryobasidium botryosum FD-172 SS1]|uniref:RNase III domain-containing protein n=1 Tax=Botryobasidium botryosum (strain FD-172 SS1) TaxID=930990 RepID=A0A067MYY5_BOTB1|nr:hypothetical protein BOTBODRAFT_51270 [Botryobasidium botryosum FD-172 SS1]